MIQEPRLQGNTGGLTLGCSTSVKESDKSDNAGER